MSELWTPTRAEIYQGHQAYFRYAAGVAILNGPREMQDLHKRDISKKGGRQEVVEHAQSLMWTGLADIIRYSNDPRYRTPLQAAEEHYEDALLNMALIAESANESRLNVLNPMIAALRPLPIDKKTNYKYVTHGHRARATVTQFMDGFTVSPELGVNVGRRTFEGIPGSGVYLGSEATLELLAEAG